MIYLDHNASGLPGKEHLEKLFEILKNENPGNPSSPHALGRNASVLLTKSRKNLAKSLNIEASEIIFTSGGTEANNLGTRAIFEKKFQENSLSKVSIITSAIEHSCVLKTFELIKNKYPDLVELIVLSPDKNGYIPISDIIKNIKSNTVLISVMAANNEIGTIQPVKEFGDFLHFMRWNQIPKNLDISEDDYKSKQSYLASFLDPQVTTEALKNLHFHVDAVQIFGKIKSEDWVSKGFDSFALSAHKVGALQGVGALILRRGHIYAPLISGGPQEKNRRAGTENLLGIISFGIIAEEMQTNDYWQKIENVKLLVHKIYDEFKSLNCIELNSQKENALPNTIHLSFMPDSKRSEDVILNLDIQGICVSSGAACSSGVNLPSRVILAMKKSEYFAKNTLRISLGPENTKNEIDKFLNLFFMMIKK